MCRGNGEHRKIKKKWQLTQKIQTIGRTIGDWPGMLCLPWLVPIRE